MKLVDRDPKVPVDKNGDPLGGGLSKILTMQLVCWISKRQVEIECFMMHQLQSLLTLPMLYPWVYPQIKLFSFFLTNQPLDARLPLRAILYA